jgi:hypothetical protein
MTQPTLANSSVVKTGNQLADIVLTPATDGPSGIVDGDLLLVWVVGASAAIPALSITGTFTTVVSGSIDGGTAVRGTLFARKASSEPASYTISGDGGATDGMVAWMHRVAAAEWTGNIVDLIASTVGTATAVATVDAPEVNATKPENLQIAFAGLALNVVRTFTEEVGNTEVLEGATDPGNAASAASCTHDGTNVGAAAKVTFTASGTGESLVAVNLLVPSPNPVTTPVIQSLGGPMTTGDTSADLASVPVPSGGANGDVLLLTVGEGDGSGGAGAIATPSGFTQQAHNSFIGSGSSVATGALLTRAQSSEPAGYAVTATPNNVASSLHARIMRIILAGATPHKIGSWVTASNSPTLAVTGVTTDIANCLVLYFYYAARPSTTQLTSYPAGTVGLFSHFHDVGEAAHMSVAALIQAAPGATGTKTFTMPANQNASEGICIAFAGAGATATVEQAIETDTAQAVTPMRAEPVGQAVETDTAQAITPMRAVAVGQATETDTAQAVAPVSFTINQAVETDTAQVITPAKAVLVGQAIETDTAQPVTGTNIHIVGQAIETDTAQPVTPVLPPSHTIVCPVISLVPVNVECSLVPVELTASIEPCA